MELEELKQDCAIKQKKGLHFILASVIIWTLLSITYSLDLPILTKNFIAFCCTAPLVPIAYFISKIIKVDFQNKSNPLTNLGILFSVNQIIYLLIAMWIFSAMPDKMLMVLAIIFGAHLMPYGWLYGSKSYMILSVVIPIGALIIGLNFEPNILAFIMIGVEVLFSLALFFENRAYRKAE
jgi:hypothetical protein